MDGDVDTEACQCGLKGQLALELAGKSTGVPCGSLAFSPALGLQAFWSYIHTSCIKSTFVW